jgi:hypothetical protein
MNKYVLRIKYEYLSKSKIILKFFFITIYVKLLKNMPI